MIKKLKATEKSCDLRSPRFVQGDYTWLSKIVFTSAKHGFLFSGRALSR
jgi:hypothetical protein